MDFDFVSPITITGRRVEHAETVQQTAPPLSRLAIVVHSLAGGGAESLAATQANHWVRRGVDVHVLTFDEPRDDDYATDPAVRRTVLYLMRDSTSFLRAVWNNRRRVKTLRSALETVAPDAVLSLTTVVNVTTLLACRRLNVPVVACEHIDPWKHPLPRSWRVLRKFTYPRAAALTVETPQAEGYFREIAPHVPIHVVPNPVKRPAQTTADFPKSPDARRRIVAMGRLVPQKGFDLLIEAFRQLAAKHPEWDVTIIGDGACREELQRQIESSGLAGRVELYGWSTNPGPLLAASDLFVFSSRYEGFGIALMDAMACGLPVISFDCPHGPAEIIRHDVDGLLVPPEDVPALKEAMDRLMSSPETRARLASRAPEVLSRYSEEKYFERWDAILRSVCQRG